MKKRLEGFKKLLESNKYLEEFDRAVFESIVDKIIIGGTNDEGEIDPAMITIIYKTGKKDSQDGRLFKSRRKNAKEVNEETDNKLYPHSSDEVNNLYSYPIDNTCGDGCSFVPPKNREGDPYSCLLYTSPSPRDS